MPVKRCKCSHICYSLCKMQGHHLAGGGGCGGIPCGLKSSHDWCMHLGTSDKLEPLLPLQCPGGRQAASWAPGTVRGSCLFAGGSERGVAHVCRGRDADSWTWFPQDFLWCTTDKELFAVQLWKQDETTKHKLPFYVCLGSFLNPSFWVQLCFVFSAQLLFPFRGACVIRRSNNIAAASIPLFQCPFWSVSWRNGEGIFSKANCT